MTGETYLRTLGSFSLIHGGRVIPVSSAKQRALLAYLALAHPRPQPRAAILTLLWGSRFEEQARQSLRQALTRLRRVLGAEFIVADRDEIGIGAVCLRCDAADLLAAVEGGTAGLREAAAASGEFLDGSAIEEDGFNEWLQQMRQRIANARFDALLRLGKAALDNGDPTEAIDHARTALQADNLREDAHRFLITALAAAGRRAEAMRHADAAERLIREELGVGLSPETLELAESLRAGAPAQSSPADAVGSVSPEAATTIAPGTAEKPVPAGMTQTVPAGLKPGERQRVTFLAIDFHDTAGLLSRLDAEDVLAARSALERLVAGTVEPLLGSICAPETQPIMVQFGYPHFSEVAAESALAAALSIVEHSRHGEIATAAAGAIVSAGIATGEVVASPTPSGPGRTRFVGMAPLIAARLQQRAAARGVLADETTCDLAGRLFECGPVDCSREDDLGSLRFRTAIRRSGIIDRYTATRRPDAPLVEREESLRTSLERWQRTLAGEEQIIVLSGEAGIGKSRLAAEIVRQTEGFDRDAWMLQCHPRGDRSPLHPLSDLLRTLRPEAAGRGREAAIQWLRDTLAAVSPELADMAGFAAYLLAGDEDEAAAGPPAAPAEMRDKAIDAACLLARSLAWRKPQLVLVEDIQWIDSLSHQLLLAAIEDCADLPVMFVLTTRTEVPGALAGEANVLSIALSRLTSEGTTRIVRSIWSPAEPPEGLVEAICARCEGNPLFAEEQASFVLSRTRDGSEDWRDLLGTHVASLQDVLTSWLDTAGAARQILQAASVIGRDFAADLLARIVPATENPAGVLDDLVASGLIRPKRGGRGNQFTFRHALIHDAAYAAMLRENRRAIHDRIAVLALNGEIADMPDETIGWHCENAGRHREAVVHLLRAAESAAARSAYSEAANLISTAAAQLEQVSGSEDPDDLRLRLLTVQGPIEIALHGTGSEQARAVYERGVELCRRSPDLQMKHFPLFWGWWFTAPDFATQSSRAEVVVEIHRDNPDPEERLQSLHCAWAAAFNLGRHDRCLALIDESLALYDADRAVASRIRYGGHDARVCGLGESGLSHWFLGEAERATAATREAVALAEQLGHLGSILHALDIAIMLATYNRDLAEVRSVAGRMMALAQQHRLPGFEAKALIFGGWADGMKGAPAEGLAKVEAGLAQQREIGTAEDFPVYLDMHCELLALANRPKQAGRVAAEAIERAENAGHRFWLAELYRRKAAVDRLAGKPAAGVRKCLERALAIADEQGAIALADRARRDIGQLASVAMR